MQNKAYFTNKKGFTLIELLVVIAIIGILSGIGLVALNGAREKARDAERLSDLSQLRTALILYSDSNKSKFPGQFADAVGDCINNTGATFLHLGGGNYQATSSIPGYANIFQNSTDPRAGLIPEFLGATLIPPLGQTVGTSYYCYDSNGTGLTTDKNDSFFLYTRLETSGQTYYWLNHAGAHSVAPTAEHTVGNCENADPACAW